MSESASKVPPKYRFPALAILIGLLLGIMIGISQVRPEGYAVVAGFAGSVLVGIFYVAPKAGRIAKQRFFQAFVSPDPQDQEMIQAASGAVISNMGSMAARALEDDELGNNLKQAFYPMFDLAGKRINQRWDMAMLNIKAQQSRGAGVFNPEMEGDEFNQGLMERVMGIFEGPMEALGIEGKFKEACRMKIAHEFYGGQNNGPGRQGAQSLPAMSGNQGKGW